MDDVQGQRGQQWLQDLMSAMGVPIEQVTYERLAADESCWLTIQSDALSAAQIDTLIGERGSVLDAIQYLANITLNMGQPETQQTAYTVELAGYRARRQAELQEMADSAAKQVRATGQEYEMPYLSSAERRQVHTLLKEHGDLATESRGREPDRRLIVRLAQAEE
jgi:spoIIIJ-associated protein